MRIHHLFAAKISVNQHLFSKPLSEVKPLFEEALVLGEGYVLLHETPWCFINSSKIEKLHNNSNLIVGRLCRGTSESKTKIDPNDGTLSKEIIQNIASWSNFIYDIDTEVIVFEERIGKISKYQFIEAFARLIQYCQPEVGELVIELLPYEQSLRDAIKSLNKIHYAKFDIVPANWDDDDDFSELDKQIKELKAQKAGLEYNSDEGLNPKAPLFRKPVNMVIAGYGKAKITGKNNENIKLTYDSSENLLSETVDIDEEDTFKLQITYYRFLRKAVEQHRRVSGDE